MPDLTASNVGVSDTTPNSGQTVTVTYRINNIGSGAAGAFDAGLYLSTDSTVTTGDAFLNFQSFSSLTGNSFTSGSITGTLPNSLMPGNTYWIGVIADDFNDINNEVSENNNTASIQVTVPASPPPPPPSAVDLTASNVSVSDTTPNPGQTVTVTYRINNTGSGSAGAFDAGIYISPPTRPSRPRTRSSISNLSVR